jgi:hypothetical protein
MRPLDGSHGWPFGSHHSIYGRSYRCVSVVVVFFFIIIGSVRVGRSLLSTISSISFFVVINNNDIIIIINNDNNILAGTNDETDGGSNNNDNDDEQYIGPCHSIIVKQERDQGIADVAVVVGRSQRAIATRRTDPRECVPI